MTRTLSFSRHVDATAEQVYDAVSDLTRMAAWSDEYLGSWRFFRGEARSGSRFVGWNRNSWHVWCTTCTVTRTDRPSAFTFDSGALGVPIASWGYLIQPEPGGGCTVTETWRDLRGDDSTGAVGRWLGSVFAGTSVQDRIRLNTVGMQRTLDRLATELEAVS